MPIAKFQMSDGRVGRFEVPEGTTPEQAQTLIQQHLSGSNPAQGITDASTPTPIDAGASLLSGVVAGPVAGLAGLATAAGKATGLTDADPADIVKKTQDALTYDPKTTQGKQIVGAVSKPFEMLASGADKAGSATADATGSPLLGAAVNAAIQAIPMIAGKVFPKGMEAGASNVGQRAAAVQTARQAGYVLTPSETGAGIVLRSAEGIAGGPTMERLASKKNANITNALGKQDLGLAPDEPITREAIAKVRASAGQAYDKVKGAGEITNDPQYFKELDNISNSYDTAAKSYPGIKNPIQETLDTLKQPTVDAASAVEMVKLLRDKANTAFASRDSSMGKAYKSAAQAVDDSMDRHLTGLAQTSNDPGLASAVADYQKARKTIAKTYLADKALNPSSGDLNAAVYAKALDKGVPLDGPAATIGNFALQFPKLAKRAELVQNAGGPKFMDLGLSAARGLFANDPMSMASLGKDIVTLGARPSLRAVMLSKPAQSLVGMKPPSLAELGNAAGNFQGSPVMSLAEMAAGQR